MANPLHTTQSRGRIWVFLLAALPFYLNDFYNIHCDDFVNWLIVDYSVVKTVPLAVLGWGLYSGRISLRDLGLTRTPLPVFLGLAVLATGLGLFLDNYGWAFFESILPDTSLSSIPFDLESPLYVMDCWVGLALVALLEETIFRGLAWTVLRRFMKPVAAVAASAALFGLIHWSQGLHAMINTALIGALFSLIMWRAGTVWPQILAHFIINFVSFCSCLYS